VQSTDLTYIKLWRASVKKKRPKTPVKIKATIWDEQRRDN
jgi:hypothetical protein